MRAMLARMSDLLRTVEAETGRPVRASVIWLHGLGADGHDFEPIVPYLGTEDLGVRFVFPHAPRRAVTINMGLIMPAWYDILGLEAGSGVDEKGIRASASRVEALVAREKERGVPAARIVLAGFSQGGAIALQAGLRHANRLGGIVALSTYLTLEDSLDAEASAANRATPIFMAHGTEDPIVPLQLADSSQRLLSARGYDVEWATWPMPHAVCAEEVEAIAAFLTRVLGGAAAPRRSSILLPG